MENKRTGRGVRLILVMAALLVTLGGCTRRTSDEGKTEPESTQAVSSETQESSETQGSSETPENRESQESSEPQAGGATEEHGEPFVQQKIVVATDMHYLAEQLSGNRCRSFMKKVESGDGRALQYGWEILDAFIADMLTEKPNLVVLSGDLTLNGAKKSHEELARKLKVLLQNKIPVIIIPGNHDINNPEACRFVGDGTEKEPSVTAAEFVKIYSDYGYADADSRDPDSLSYTYIVDDYYRLLMLDSCQYNPVNQVGGMIRHETYDWIESQMESAWEEGAQFITVSHHNLLDQSGVSREFYDNCTIEHSEQLLQILYDWQVRLHLSGHLHLQHHMQDGEGGIHEVVTGSLVMAPCHYGVLKLMDDGTFLYDAKSVNVDDWAKRHNYKNRELTDFTDFGARFLNQVAYHKALSDLREHTMERKLFLSDERMEEMAQFYAKLCVYYYSGRMFEVAESVKSEPAYEYWNEVDYISDLSDFLRNILSDDAKDFSHLAIPYE
ncbi:MAG: metallophosphoesterase [Clostridium sp.]